MVRPRFSVDEMLGSLARWLRIMGYDASYEKDMTDSEILASARAEDRIVLTRDKELAMRAGKSGMLVESDNIDEQLRQVIERFDLKFNEPLTRCSICNAELEEIPPEAVEGEVPPLVKERQKEFFRCRGCGQIYWKGTHWENILKRLREMENG